MLKSIPVLKWAICNEVASAGICSCPGLDFEHNIDDEHNVANTVENREALNRFLASVERRAYRMAEIATGNRDHALDIVQDSMMALVKNYSHKNESDWGPLFHRILQSKIRDWYRRSRTRNKVFTWLRSFHNGDENDDRDPIQQAADTVSLSPDESTGNEQLLNVALDAVRQLPLRQQQAFLLRAWEGLDVSETARAMKCSQGSVKTHYSRATRALKKKLEAYSV